VIHLAISLLIHLLVLCFIDIEYKVPPLRQKSNPLRVKIKIKKPPKTKLAHKKNQSSSGLSFKSLGLPPGYIPKNARLGRFGEGHENDRGISESGGLLIEIKERIEEYRYYPQVFLQSKISGQAKVRLVFNRAGHICMDRMIIRASSPYIKVLLTNILKEAFKTPLRTNFSTQKKYFTIDLAHSFYLPETLNQSQLKASEFLTENAIFMVLQPPPTPSALKGFSDGVNKGVMFDFSSLGSEEMTEEKRIKALKTYRENASFN
tara:strand:+ start:1951 stop:2736 length:786 start_codon:yes stop_codon:yes gene_type:complete